MKFFFVRMLVLLIVASFAGAAQEFPATYEELVGEIAEEAVKPHGWSAKFDMSASLGPTPMNARGVMAGRGKMLVTKMDMKVGPQQVRRVMVVDEDGVSWMEAGVLGQVQVRKMDLRSLGAKSEDAAYAAMLFEQASGAPLGLGQPPLDMLEGFERNYTLTVTGAETMDDAKVYVLEGRVKEGSLSTPESPADVSTTPFAAVRLWVDAKTGFGRRVAAADTTGKAVLSFTFSDVDMNASLGPDTFDYTPPQGAVVQDVTESVRKEMERRQPQQPAKAQQQ